MALIPFLIAGNVRKGPLQDYTEYNYTYAVADGSLSADLFLSSGVQLATSQTVTFYNNTTKETITATTDANGDYQIDIANFITAVDEGNIIRISTSTVDPTAKSDAAKPDRNHLRYQDSAKADRNLLSDRRANEHTEQYPLPVELQNNYLGEQNPSWSATYSGGLIATETVVIKGVSYRKSYTWTAGSLTDETRWVRI